MGLKLPIFTFNLNKNNCVRTSYNVRRYYSTYSNQPQNYISTPVPIKIFDNKETVFSYDELLRNKAGIYCFFFYTINNKRYIGSAKDLYLRLIEYLAGKKSNTALQKSILKYGLDKFYFCVYEYFTYHKVVSNKALTDLETSYIEKYPFNSLYDFMWTVTSLEDNLIAKFKNNIELSKYLNISRVTVGKYINSGLIYKNQYRFKVNSK